MVSADVAALSQGSLMLWGVHTGLHLDLMVPAIIGALGSLRYSESTNVWRKYIEVLVSAALGAWSAYPAALLMLAVTPEAATVPVMLSRYLVALGVGYAGLALLDKRLGLQRRRNVAERGV